MFSPKLYTVRKMDLKYIVRNEFSISLGSEEEAQFHINEQDNMLFRQIRKITSDYSRYNKYIVFIDCKSASGKEEEALSALILNGFTVNGQEFVIGERSASMTRNSILSFVDRSIAAELDERVSMGAAIEKTVLSKYYAYRGLMLSSCHCIEDWYPEIVIVPDYYRVIPNQRIKYLYDSETSFTDKNGAVRPWKQKDIAETVRDVRINVFDGCGIHHPAVTGEVRQRLSIDTNPTSILWRAPYIKGVTHEANYVEFFGEHGVSEITDIWGEKHGVTAGDPPLIIMFESMYKGLKYFKRSGTYADWQYYWTQFKKYGHCIGAAKWNFSLEEEPAYTRGNYQILQDLQLSYADFAGLARDSVEWAEKIINGDTVYTYCFLGLFADRQKSLNDYTRAILKNSEMLKETGVRSHIINLADKYINDMKCGKLWLKGSFKLVVPDIIMMMEHIGGLETDGCLEAGEFFSQDKDGAMTGKRVIERNPHICHSEHTILAGTDNEKRQRYCPNLINVCMVNGKSLVMQRLQGGDSDGDLVLVLDNDMVKSGINREAVIVMDIDDKITVEDEADTPANKLKITLRTMKNLIGEYSNYSCAYHNKTPKTAEQKRKYEQYIDIISVLTGKSIDYAKTGVLYPMPRNIAKFGRPLPYFMKYRSEYYRGQKLSRSGSNMNKLCWELEKWEKQFRWKWVYNDFDYTIMINYNVGVKGHLYAKIEEIYLDFCKEMAQLKKDEKSISQEYRGYVINWQHYYERYRIKCETACPDRQMLANIAVKLCYEKYPGRNKKFIWRVAGAGVVENIKQTDAQLPMRSDSGEYEYLGKKYSLVHTSVEKENFA